MGIKGHDGEKGDKCERGDRGPEGQKGEMVICTRLILLHKHNYYWLRSQCHSQIHLHAHSNNIL